MRTRALTGLPRGPHTLKNHLIAQLYYPQLLGLDAEDWDQDPLGSTIERLHASLSQPVWAVGLYVNWSTR